MKKSMVLFVTTIVLLSAVLAGCPPPFGRHGHPPVPVPSHPPMPRHP